VQKKHPKGHPNQKSPKGQMFLIPKAKYFFSKGQNMHFFFFFSFSFLLVICMHVQKMATDNQ